MPMVQRFGARPRFQGGPAVSADDAVVFVGSHDGFVYAVDALDGSELWRYDAGGGSRPVGGAPALSPDGALLCVQIKYSTRLQCARIRML